MSSPYDTSSLLELLNNLEMIPTNQNTYETSDFLALMNHTLQNDILPTFLSTNEEYFVKYEDFQVDQNTASLDIPPSAIGMRARQVLWMTTDGFIQELPRLQPEVLSGASAFGGYSSTPGYYLQQNQIVFYPRLQGAGTIRITFFKRPNLLTDTMNCGQIVAINTGTNTVTLDVAPDTDTWDTGTVLDAIHSYQPFDFASEQISIVSRSGLDFVFSPQVIATLSVGDYLASTGYSPFVQYLPVEAHGLLVQGTAKKVLQGLGDSDNLKIAAAIYKEMEEKLFKMIAPRIQSQTKKIGSTKGILGVSRYGGRWNNIG